MTQSPTPTQLKLDDASRQQIRDARVRRKRIDRVLATARFNGWSEGILAGLSVLVALVDPTLISVLIAGVLIGVTCVEFHSRAMVKSLNCKGLTYLTFNQLAFGCLIMIYAVWQLFALSQGGDPQLAELASMGKVGQQIVDLEQHIIKMVYGTLIAGTFVFQGGMALFYHRSKTHLTKFVQDTPAWVIDVLKVAR